jgi:hypothetical protein
MTPQDTNDSAHTTKKLRAYKKAHARYAGMLLAAIGFLANVTAIVGLINDHVNTLVTTAAVLAILCGLYFLLKRWGKPVGGYTLLAVAILVAGSVMLTLAWQARTPSTQDAGDDTPNTVSPTDTNPTHETTPSPTGNHTVIMHKSFTLPSQASLELDDKKGTIVAQQSGAHAPFDLYLSDYPALFATVNKFYAYQPDASGDKSDKGIYNSCQTLIATSQLGDNIIVDVNQPDEQYCMLTTKGRLALITLEEIATNTNDKSKSSATFSIKLWD